MQFIWLGGGVSCVLMIGGRCAKCLNKWVWYLMHCRCCCSPYPEAVPWIVSGVYPSCCHCLMHPRNQAVLSLEHGHPWTAWKNGPSSSVWKPLGRVLPLWHPIKVDHHTSLKPLLPPLGLMLSVRSVHPHGSSEPLAGSYTESKGRYHPPPLIAETPKKHISCNPAHLGVMLSSCMWDCFQLL